MLGFELSFGNDTYISTIKMHTKYKCKISEAIKEVTFDLLNFSNFNNLLKDSIKNRDKNNVCSSLNKIIFLFGNVGNEFLKQDFDFIIESGFFDSLKCLLEVDFDSEIYVALVKCLAILASFKVQDDIINHFINENLFIRRILDIFNNESLTLELQIWILIFCGNVFSNPLIANSYIHEIMNIICSILYSEKNNVELIYSICFTCFSISYKTKIPDEYVKGIVVAYRMLHMQLIEINNDLSKIIQLYILQTIYYISKHSTSINILIESAIPNYLFGIVKFCNDQKLLKYILKILLNILNGCSKENFLLFRDFFDFEYFKSIFSSKDPDLILINCKIFNKLILYDNNIIYRLLETNFINEILACLNDLNYETKREISNLISNILINCESNESLSSFINQDIVELLIDFTNIENQDFGLGALTRIFTLTFDNPEIHHLIEPYVLDT